MTKKLSDAAKAERARLRKLKARKEKELNAFAHRAAEYLVSEECGLHLHNILKDKNHPYRMFEDKMDGEKIKIIFLRRTDDNPLNNTIIVTSDERNVGAVFKLKPNKYHPRTQDDLYLISWIGKLNEWLLNG